MNEKIDLNMFPFFSGIPSERIEQMSELFSSIYVEKRHQLRLSKHLKDAIFFVNEGRIKISYFTECGKEFIITILEQGDIYTFHSEAVLNALTDSHVWQISMNNFKKIMMDFPFLNYRMYKLLGSLLKSYNDLVINLAYKEVSSRLANYLLENPATNDWVTLGLTHEELSCHLGSTRQTISTTLNRWERQGLIELQRGYVRIINRDNLLKLV